MENNKAHILIVDDDNRIRDLLKEYLRENNYIVSTSKNALNFESPSYFLRLVTFIRLSLRMYDYESAFSVYKAYLVILFIKFNFNSKLIKWFKMFIF